MDISPEQAARRFRIDGDVIDVAPQVAGHIHDSFIVTAREACGRKRYLLQRLNTTVFPRPAEVMENIRRVLEHLRGKLAAVAAPDIERRVLTLVPATAGAGHALDSAGRVWRMYHFIEGTRTFTSPRSSAQATAAARAFGEFQALLADLPSPPLHETIPHFHDTPRRFAALRTSIADDAHRRAANAADEIAFCLAREASAGLLTDLHRRGAIPQRIVHNDAKISNVLFDDAGREAICVVDLDTVMPGLSLYDFGDMVRSMACSAAEDERDLSRVEVSPERFAALAAGYLEAAGDLLVPAEREHLVDAARIITLEQGVRFLTDHLDGDRYYRTQRPNQNLDRCRTQLKLVASIERQSATLRRAASA